MKKEISLAEMARELGINKSKLNYYQLLGFLEPVSYIGKQGVFNKKASLAIIKEIDVQKGKGMKLKEIKKASLKV